MLLFYCKEKGHLSSKSVLNSLFRYGLRFLRHYNSFCNAGLRPYPLLSPGKGGELRKSDKNRTFPPFPYGFLLRLLFPSPFFPLCPVFRGYRVRELTVKGRLRCRRHYVPFLLAGCFPNNQGCLGEFLYFWQVDFFLRDFVGAAAKGVGGQFQQHDTVEHLLAELVLGLFFVILRQYRGKSGQLFYAVDYLN